LNADGTISVSSGTSAGTYSVTYQICENLNPSNCDQATVTVDVSAAFIDAVVDTYGPINGYTGGTTGSVLSNDELNGSLVNASEITLTSVAVPSGLTLNADGTISVSSFTSAGTYSVTYQICENLNPSNCDQATVTIEVVNNAPEANQDSLFIDEDNSGVIDIVSNDVDIDGNLDPASITIVDQPDNGTITIDPVTGAITYTSNSNWNGTDSLIYQICDLGTPALCDTATLIITVNPINDSPSVNQDIATTDEDIPVIIDVVLNDTDIDGGLDVSTINIVVEPTNGTLIIDPITGEITYQPNLGFIGTDSFIYNICDNGTPLPAICDTAIVTIAVSPCLTNPALDCDGDGVTNGSELVDGTDPSNPCSFVLSSASIEPSVEWNTSDCDQDGVTNGTEVIDGTNPLNPCQYEITSITLPQLDQWLNSDCDDDGVINGQEEIIGIDPFNPDTDGDGVIAKR
jgi:hypothetical protein